MSPICNLRIEYLGPRVPGVSAREHYREALYVQGPRLDASLSPLSGPAPRIRVAGSVLVDTGALASCVDCRAAEQAGLSVVGEGRMGSATHPNEVVPIYAGRLRVRDFVDIDLMGAYGANLDHQGLIALIGRDVLRLWTVVYNGPEGLVTLSR